MLEKHILRNNPDEITDSRIQTKQLSQHTESKFPTLLKVLMLLFFVCVLLFVTTIAVLRMPSVQIRQVSVAGTVLLDPAVITDTSMRFLSEKKLFAIPRGNSVLFNKNSLDNYLKKTYPIIATLESSFIEPYHIQLTLREYVQAYLWCTDSTMDDCYRADETGFIYDHAPNYSRGVYPVMITGVSDSDTHIGNTIFTTPYEKTLLEQIITELSDSGFTVTVIDTSSVYDYQLFVSSLNQQPLSTTTSIKVSKKPQTLPLRETLELLLRDKVFQKDLITKKLEYIDLRFPEKIFYKFSNTNHAPEPLDTITTTN